MKTENIIKGHQGDVQFKTAFIPPTAQRINNIPLAYGEVSGHIHVLTGDVELFDDNGNKYAKVGNGGGRLQHVLEGNLKDISCMTEVKELPVADHKSILLPPGTYEIGIQKQYNPFEKVFERVVD